VPSKETDPAIFTPEKAADFLRKLGYPDEYWQDMLDTGLSNHWNRVMARIALDNMPMDVNVVSDEMFGNEEHGPMRKENIRASLNKNELIE
jgi:hypothetical protein